MLETKSVGGQQRLTLTRFSLEGSQSKEGRVTVDTAQRTLVKAPSNRERNRSAG